MKNALTFAAVAEAATGLALLIVPSLIGELLLGQQLTGVAVPVARVAGIALFALGPPLVGMLAYSALVTLYLAYLGFAGGATGVLLWPAVALHVVLTALLTHDRHAHTTRIMSLHGRYCCKSLFGVANENS